MRETYEKPPRFSDEQFRAVHALLAETGYRNPAFPDDPLRITAEAKHEIADVYFTNGESRPENHTERNIAALRISFASRALQIAGNPLAEEGAWQGCDAEEFFRAPRVIEKTAQEVLTAETDRKVFPKPEKPEDEGKFLPHILIDPRRISSRLLENLGLEEFISPKRTLFEDRLRRITEAIPEIKKILASLQPLSAPRWSSASPRLFRIAKSPRISEGVGLATPIPERRKGKGTSVERSSTELVGETAGCPQIKDGHAHEGYLLGTQEIHQQDRFFKTDMHGVLLRFEHIREQYRQEIQKLGGILTIFIRVHKALESWKKNWPKEKRIALKEETEPRLLEQIDTLMFVSNPHKVRLRQMAEKSLEMLGKDNPSAAMGSIFPHGKRGLYDLIGKRHEEMRRIQQVLSRDQDGIQLLHALERSVLHEFYATVENYQDKLKILDPKTSLAPAQTERICQNLSALREKLAGIAFQPNLAFAKAMIAVVDQCLQSFGDGEKRAETSRSFMQLFLFAKLSEWHEALYNNVYRYIAIVDADRISTPYLFKTLDEMVEQITRRRVAPQIATPEFDALWGKIHALLHGLRRDAGDLKKTKGKEAKVKIVAEMKDRIRLLDIPQLIGEQIKTIPGMSVDT